MAYHGVAALLATLDRAASGGMNASSIAQHLGIRVAPVRRYPPASHMSEDLLIRAYGGLPAAMDDLERRQRELAAETIAAERRVAEESA
jgi:hypothetical protein